jgi:hypothetical protein
VLASGYTCPVDAMHFSVSFPAEFDAQPTLISGYHGDTAFNDFDIECLKDSYSATMLTKMQDHDSLRLTMTLPDGYFDLRYMPGKTSSADAALFWGLLALCLIYWFFRLRNGLLLPKTRKILPLDANAGELGYQLTCDKPDLTSMVMQWANLGYLSVYRNRRGRIILRRRMDMGNERKRIEGKVFNDLFRRDGVCDAQSLRFRSAAKKIGPPFRSYWDKRLFDSHSGSASLLRCFGLLAAYAVNFMAFDLALGTFTARWIVIPLLAVPATALCWPVQGLVRSLLRRQRRRPLLRAAVSIVLLLLLGMLSGCGGYMVLNLFLQLFVGFGILFGGLRSRGGRDRILQLLGFRRYLRAASRAELLRSLQTDSLYYYHILPYAEALGLGKRFSRQFGEIRMEPCAWLQDAGGVPATAGEFYEVYAAITAAMREEPTSLLPWSAAPAGGGTPPAARTSAHSGKKTPHGASGRTAPVRRQPQFQYVGGALPPEKEQHVRPHRRPEETFDPDESGNEAD